eukprot:3538032-Amphidinium_carterae.1
MAAPLGKRATIEKQNGDAVHSTLYLAALLGSLQNEAKRNMEPGRCILTDWVGYGTLLFTIESGAMYQVSMKTHESRWPLIASPSVWRSRHDTSKTQDSSFELWSRPQKHHHHMIGRLGSQYSTSGLWTKTTERLTIFGGRCLRLSSARHLVVTFRGCGHEGVMSITGITSRGSTESFFQQSLRQESDIDVTELTVLVPLGVSPKFILVPTSTRDSLLSARYSPQPADVALEWRVALVSMCILATNQGLPRHSQTRTQQGLSCGAVLYSDNTV